MPGSLAGVVEAVVGLGDLEAMAPQDRRLPDAGAGAGAQDAPGPHAGPSPCAAATERGTTATTLATAYSMTSLEPADEGQGETVGIYELEPYLPGDISAFENCYTPSPTTVPTAVPVDGAAPNAGPGTGESALDIEEVIGLAPKAAVDVYVGPNGGLGPLDVYAAMIDQDAAQVLSTSWGECEPAAGTAVIEAEGALLSQAVAQGQTVVAAAGDEGSLDCDVPGLSTDSSLEVDDPASQPDVTGVGGTDLLVTGPPTSETVWNTGLIEGTGGGGVSRLWTMPSWQLGPGVENAATRADDSYTGQSPCGLSSGAGTVSCREVPDVAALGDPNMGFATYFDGTWQAIGGTSMGAPLWAAVTALADEALGAPGSRLGLLNPALYDAGCRSTPP
ncbi:MAG: S53 family peptidase, partial [Acidimicrobiales bacterium]